MQTSSQPKLLPIPFADAGSKQDIPNDSQIGIVAGRASYNDGFPPLTRTPLAGGGVPPFGTDFNGVFNDITAAIRWSQAGAGYPFNAAFNTAVSGYPKGARIPNSALDGFWLNTTDGNSVNPENTTSALTGWVPSGVYGTTAITGLSGSSVTLTTLQASKDRITLAGTLTANINMVVPAWIKRWEIINNCTGAFSVTVKTPTGTGVTVPAGSNANVFGDGVNVGTSYAPGALINIQVFNSSGTYTKTPGAKKALSKVQAAGGAAGGVAPTTGGANYVSSSSGGGAGAYGETNLIDLSGVATVPVTVGVGGKSGVNSDGSAGGLSSFGSYLSAPGGAGATAGPANTTQVSYGNDLPSSGNCTGSSVAISIPGKGGTGALASTSSSPTGIKSGAGGDSFLGRGGRAKSGSSTTSENGSGYGSGGGGNASGAGAATGFAGGNGADGIVIVMEFA